MLLFPTLLVSLRMLFITTLVSKLKITYSIKLVYTALQTVPRMGIDAGIFIVYTILNT